MTDELVYSSNGVDVYCAEALELLRRFPDNCVHSVVCDPQYGLSNVSTTDTIAAIAAWVSGDRERVPVGKGFMGNDWDAFVPPPAIWDECYRVLTPGGHLLSFAGTRMADLTGLSIRLAGFEIRDSIDCIGHRISWLYGSGFPKSYNVGDGWGTALKPAHEPIIVARKPLIGTVVSNVDAFGTGAINIDECRVPGKLEGDPNRFAKTNGGSFASFSQFPPTVRSEGRWPPNVLFTHVALLDAEIGEPIGDACADGCVEGCPVLELDCQSGYSVSRKSLRGDGIGQGYHGSDKQWNTERGCNDSGGASRFFPQFRWQAKAPNKERPRVDGVAHPTVKPLGLVRWLVRLVTPPNGTVLDWCAGSGPTGEAAIVEGLNSILIEREEQYIPLIIDRLSSPIFD